MKQIILLAIIIVIVVIFVARSNILSEINWRKIISTSTPEPVVLDFSNADSSGTVIASDIPKGFTAKDLSPYFRKVSVTAKPPENGTGSAETIILRSNLQAAVNVTGWKIRSNTGSFTVPGAVLVYNPAVPPAPQNIVLAPGHILNVYSSVSPLDADVRLNSCSGYLNDTYFFYPPMPQTCAAVDRQAFATLSGVCQDYILSLKTCEVPSVNPPVAFDDFACRNYLNTLNYSGCIKANRNKSDFFADEWRVWMGKRILDELHDRVLLFDKSGLLVDQFIY